MEWNYKGWVKILPPKTNEFEIKETQMDWNQTLISKLNYMNSLRPIKKLLISDNLKPLIESLTFKDKYPFTYIEHSIDSPPNSFNFKLNEGFIKNGEQILKITNLKK